MNPLVIDGSHGEGGGQILRTTLSLAAILSRPVRIVNIRAGRKQPGLRPQHVQAVKAAAAICNAQLAGVKEHSRELTFEPQGPPQPGAYRFDIGTAGAATLVLQTVLLPLSLTGQPAKVTVQGGTHVAWSPPYQYFAEVYLPAIAALGFRAEARLIQWGFYPKGGGEIELRISPGGEETPAADEPSWTRPRGPISDLQVLSAAANVGNQVTARQARQATNRLLAAGFQPRPRLLNPKSRGPGTCLLILAEYEGGSRAGFAGFGRQGYPAERVADEAVDAFLAFDAAEVPVDPHLADQLVLPLAISTTLDASLAGRPLAFQTSEVTQHLLTNIRVVAQFLGGRFAVEGREGQPGLIRLSADSLIR